MKDWIKNCPVNPAWIQNISTFTITIDWFESLLLFKNKVRLFCVWSTI